MNCVSIHFYYTCTGCVNASELIYVATEILTSYYKSPTNTGYENSSNLPRTLQSADLHASRKLVQSPLDTDGKGRCAIYRKPCINAYALIHAVSDRLLCYCYRYRLALRNRYRLALCNGLKPFLFLQEYFCDTSWITFSPCWASISYLSICRAGHLNNSIHFDYFLSSSVMCNEFKEKI